MKTKLYYEGHVTIEPVFEEHLEALKQIAQSHGFRVAELLMQKRSDDTPERSRYDTFMTGHSPSFQDLAARTANLVREAQIQGYKVWRYKIENTIIDSRSDDVLGLLSVSP